MSFIEIISSKVKFVIYTLLIIVLNHSLTELGSTKVLFILMTFEIKAFVYLIVCENFIFIFHFGFKEPSPILYVSVSIVKYPQCVY